MPWIERVGLLKAFETISYEMQGWKDVLKKNIMIHTLHGFPFNLQTLTRTAILLSQKFDSTKWCVVLVHNV